MNSDAGFLRYATKLGIPSFIRLGILSADFGVGEFQSLQSGAIILRQRVTIQIKAVTSCSNHKIDQQETDG